MLLILTESPNKFHEKSTKRKKVGVVSGAKFEPNWVQCCEKTKKLAYSIGFFHILNEEYI